MLPKALRFLVVFSIYYVGANVSPNPSNYLEVEEGDITYRCLPADQFSPSSTFFVPSSASSNEVFFDQKEHVRPIFGETHQSEKSLFHGTGAGVGVTAVSLPGPDNSVTLNVAVTSLGDPVVNTSACITGLSPCSLRSVLLLCAEELSPPTSQPSNTTSCIITLPEGGKEIVMDPLMGHVSLTSILAYPNRNMRGILSIVGNNCIVTSNSSSGVASRFMEVIFSEKNDFFDLILENFTIANFGDESIEGSGLYYYNLGKGKLLNMAFIGNLALNGAGIYIDESHKIDFVSCLFKENNASMFGGGVHVQSQSHHLSFTDCVFDSNFCVDDGGKLPDYMLRYEMLPINNSLFCFLLIRRNLHSNEQ